jgi:hypothetical protein
MAVLSRFIVVEILLSFRLTTVVLFGTGGGKKHREPTHALARIDTGLELGSRSYRSGATVDLVHR